MKINFIHNIPLIETMCFEKVYPENLQLDLEEKKELLDSGAEFIYLVDKDTGNLIGETYFISLNKLEEEIEGTTKFRGQNCAYVYSTTILPEYQGKRYGAILKGYFYGYIKNKFDFVLGHARHNGSVQLNELFGAEIIDTFDNWYDTGERYYLYKRYLK